MVDGLLRAHAKPILRSQPPRAAVGETMKLRDLIQIFMRMPDPSDPATAIARAFGESTRTPGEIDRDVFMLEARCSEDDRFKVNLMNRVAELERRINAMDPGEE